MEFNSPLSSEKAERIIRVLDLAPSHQVLDAGCGRGEFLIRLIEASGAFGLGLDVDAESIAAAKVSAAARVPADRFEFRVADLQHEVLSPDSLDLAICMGSTHAFGDGDSAYPNAIEKLSRAVRPGGRILIGEGYWKQPPAPEYLELIGDPVGIYRDHAGNIAFAEQLGLTPFYAVVSSDDEWDHFEWSHRMRLERELSGREDREATEKLQQSRAWRDGYLRWGRDTMGFGFYLFLRPS